MKRLWLLILSVLLVSGLSGCGSGGSSGSGTQPGPQPVTKAADFTTAELAGNTIYIANPATRTGTYDAVTFHADGTVSAVSGISGAGGGTPLSGSWGISAGILQATINGKPAESFTKVSAGDSNGSFTVAASSGATGKWFFNQMNGAAQAFACASGTDIPAPVTLRSITVTPGTLTTGVGWTQQLQAVGSYTDSSTRDLTASVTWSSSNTGAVTVTAAGVLNAVAAGPATVTAAFGSVTGTATVAVTYNQPSFDHLAVAPQGNSGIITLPIGATQQFQVTAYYGGNASRDVTTQVTWSSSDTSVATVSASGLATAVGTGLSNISASFADARATVTIYSGETVIALAGVFAAAGYADGTGTSAAFKDPTSITAVGNYLYVADAGNNCIRRVDKTTGTVTTLAGSASAWGAVDGTGANARFYTPAGITSDGTNLYVTDYANNTIRKIVISTGAVTTLAGSPGVSGAVDGSGSGALFKGPTGITTDGRYLYIADSGNKALRKLDLGNNGVTTLVSGAVFASLVDSATGLGELTTDGTNLYGIVTHSQYYVPGAYLYKVALSSGGAVTVLPAQQDLGLRYPIAVATDGANLYVADQQTHHGSYQIYKMALATGKTTFLTANYHSNFDNLASGFTLQGNTLYIATGGYNTVAAIQMQ